MPLEHSRQEAREVPGAALNLPAAHATAVALVEFAGHQKPLRQFEQAGMLPLLNLPAGQTLQLGGVPTSPGGHAARARLRRARSWTRAEEAMGSRVREWSQGQVRGWAAEQAATTQPLHSP